METAKSFECDIGTVREVRTWIAGILLAQNTPQNIINDIILSASEAVTNSILHGYADTHAGRIDVRVLLLPDSISLTIRDYGSGIGNKHLMSPDLNIPHDGGYGVYLIHALMDRVNVKSLDKGTELHMTKSINTPST